MHPANAHIGGLYCGRIPSPNPPRVRFSTCSRVVNAIFGANLLFCPVWWHPYLAKDVPERDATRADAPESPFWCSGIPGFWHEAAPGRETREEAFMGRLQDRVAIVTGGGRGIGRATALLLADEGAHVAVLARTPAEVEATAAEIRTRGGLSLPVTADVARWDEVQRVVTQIIDAFGRVDILVNNAGIIEPIMPMARADPDVWSYNLDVNLKGPFYMARAVVPRMLEAGQGVIVNVGSGAAQRVITSWSAYCTAKAGLWHLTRVMAAELAGTGIRVNSVRPGVVDTDMQKRIRAASVEDFGRENLFRFRRLKEENMLLPPEHPARLIVWLCTDEAQDIHGQEANIYEATWRQRAGLYA